MFLRRAPLKRPPLIFIAKSAVKQTYFFAVSSLCKSEKFIFSRRGFKPYFERIERQKPRKIVIWRAEKKVY